MYRTLISISALLFAMAILLAGQGLQGTLLPVRASIEAFSDIWVGFMGSAYFGGFIGGCLMGPYLVHRVGHIRTFSALAATASAMPLLHAILVEPAAWAFFRAATGFCFAGLYMVIESWLNERTTASARGGVLSAYNVINQGALMVGQLLLMTADPKDFTLFALASVLLSLALVPVSLTSAVQPAPIATARLDLRRLWVISPVAVGAALAVGLVGGAFWTLGPVFAQRLGLDQVGIATFMAVSIMGAALWQWPVGRMSDFIDRRIIVAFEFAGASLMGALLFFFAAGAAGTVLLFVAATFFGAFSMSVYAVAVAHANDRSAPNEFVSVAGGLLLLYGTGAMLGPFLASLFTEWLGPEYLFAFTTAVHGAVFLFVIYRIRVQSGVSNADRGDYQPVNRTSHESAVLDPRAEPEDEAIPAS